MRKLIQYHIVAHEYDDLIELHVTADGVFDPKAGVELLAPHIDKPLMDLISAITSDKQAIIAWDKAQPEALQGEAFVS